MTKRKALGSGLEALLSSRPTDDSKSKRKNNADFKIKCYSETNEEIEK